MDTDALLIDRSVFRRWAGAVCLLAAGPLILAGLLATPLPDDAVTTLREPVRTQLSADLLFLGYLLLVPGLFAMLRLVGRRGAILSHVGLVLAVPGLVALPGLLSTDFTGLGIAQVVGPAQADAVSRHLGALPGALVLFLPVKYAGPIGLALVAGAVWRSRSVGWWAALATAAGILAMAILARGVETVEVTGAVVFTVGLAGMALGVVRSAPEAPSVAGTAATMAGSMASAPRA